MGRVKGMFLGFLKNALISLSVVFGGFGVNFGSSVIDSFNSSNVFKTHVKQVNSSSSPSYNVGDVIFLSDNYYKVIESNTDSLYSQDNYNFKNSSKFVYISYWSSNSINERFYTLVARLDTNNFVEFVAGAPTKSNNFFTFGSNLKPYAISPVGSLFYKVPLFLTFNKPFSFKISFSSSGMGDIKVLVLSPTEAPKPLNAVTESISIIVSGLTEFGKGLGKGISDIVTAMMYTGEGVTKALSPFFVMVLVFASIALCVSLTTLIFNWLRNLGGN